MDAYVCETTADPLVGTDFTPFWMEACRVTSEMEAAGAYFDVDRCQAAHARAAADLSTLEATWADASGGVNAASPKQLVEFLYTNKKFPLPPVTGTLKAVKKRQRDEQPTSEASLDWLWRKAKKPENKALLRCLLDLRKVTKFTQFLSKLPEFVHEGRIYASFGPDTGTGRLASRNPNLQNIPGGDPYGIRACFVAPMAHTLLVADFAALEPRILAHYLIVLFGDYSLHDAIESGDLYAAVACRTWPDKLRGITPKELKEHPNPEIKKLRAIAKTIVLGTNYGKSPQGLAVQLGVSDEEGKILYDDYFRAYPGIRAFQEWAYAQAKAENLRTLLGRTRLFPLGTSPGEVGRAQRQATNTVIQGSAADVVFAAMVAQARYHQVGTLQMQIHDELVWRVPEQCIGDTSLIDCMEHPFTVDLKIPLRVSYKYCSNWAEGKD
jgi:DNA polymerase-1